MHTPTQMPVVSLLLAAYAGGVALSLWIDWRLAVIGASTAFFALYLTRALFSLDDLNEHHLKKVAVRSDAPAYVVFSVILGTVATALFSLFLIINADVRPSSVWLVVALASVPLGWATIHMMAAFHYAHLFWRRDKDGVPRKGLEFAGGLEPDGWDFVYFSFVIGMAAQTSDVSITGRRIRRFALVHSVIAYFYNAVLIAAAVNVVVASN